MVFKSKAPALLPWYSMANSPETCSNDKVASGSVRPSLKDLPFSDLSFASDRARVVVGVLRKLMT